MLAVEETLDCVPVRVFLSGLCDIRFELLGAAAATHGRVVSDAASAARGSSGRKYALPTPTDCRPNALLAGI
jgi:hypothetical protein